jgi:hypothetical protein
MSMKYGYKSVDEYRQGVQKKFSLLETGIIQKPSTRLLLINVSPTPCASLVLEMVG